MRMHQRKHSRHSFIQNHNIDRIAFVKWVVFVLCCVIAGRLFQLQIIQGGEYRNLAIKNHGLNREIYPKRGKIYVHDRNEKSALHPIATEKDYYDIYVVPSELENHEEVVEDVIKILHPIILEYRNDKEDGWVKINPDIEVETEEVIENDEVEEDVESTSILLDNPLEEDDEPTDEELLQMALDEREVLLTRFSKTNDPYEPIRMAAEESLAAQIMALKVEGIGVYAKPLRYYPDGDIFSQITGFWGYNETERVGRYGIEEYFEEILKGEKGQYMAEKDASGGLIPTADLDKTEVKDGADVVLTLDYPIQFNACNELKNAVEKYDAEGGSVLVMDPRTGAILAMCNYPTYNANEYSKVEDINLFLNKSVSYTYEPGSVFKPFTMSAALDTGVLKPNDTYNDTGEIKIGQYTIRNSDKEAHGVQTMLEILQKSLNTGVVYMTEKAGKNVFKDYVHRFGFDQTTEIELPGEISGNISSLDKAGDIYAATASYGQGITVTPLQLVSAFSSIANHGRLMKPHVIDKIVYADGTLEETKPRQIRQVMSSESAITLSAMLASVVEKGYGSKAGVEGYYLAGKTGTAQVSAEDRAGYSSDTIHSFAGFGPVSEPRFTILVKLDKPTAVAFSSDSAAPVFKKIAQFIINYYGIKPEK